MAPVVFRSTFNRVLSIMIWATLATVTVAVVSAPGAMPMLASVPLGAAGCAALVWALLWAPHVRVDDTGVRVANILLEHFVPWPALIHIDTQYSLTLHTPHRRIRVTAAPAPGQLTAFRATRAEKRRLGHLGTGGVRPGDLPGTDSGVAADMVHVRWERLRDTHSIPLGAADTTAVSTRPRLVEIAAIVLGSAAVAAAILSV